MDLIVHEYLVLLAVREYLMLPVVREYLVLLAVHEHLVLSAVHEYLVLSIVLSISRVPRVLGGSLLVVVDAFFVVLGCSKWQAAIESQE